MRERRGSAHRPREIYPPQQKLSVCKVRGVANGKASISRFLQGLSREYLSGNGFR